jgi:hypothetical protein
MSYMVWCTLFSFFHGRKAMEGHTGPEGVSLYGPYAGWVSPLGRSFFVYTLYTPVQRSIDWLRGFPRACAS